MDIPSVQKWKIARITNMASASTQKTESVAILAQAILAQALSNNLLS